MKSARKRWHARFKDVKLNRLVFLDEFGASTQMTRTLALALAGERAICRLPHGHWKVISTIAAMSSTGMIAAASFDGATDTDAFVQFVQDELIPQLKPGQIVVMDNLPVHKSCKVDELIGRANCSVLRLPPYSPDLNPIEMAISKIKRLLRSIAERDVGKLQKAIGRVLKKITAKDAIGFMRHCGYCDKCV